MLKTSVSLAAVLLPAIILLNTVAPSPASPEANPTDVIVEEISYPLSVRTLSQPILVQEEKAQPQESEDRVLAAAAEVVRAMAAGNFSRWLQTWDEPSSATFIERTRGSIGPLRKKTEAQWRSEWASITTGCSVHLTALAATPSFSMVAIELRRPEAKRPIGEPGMDFGFKDGILRTKLLFVERDGHFVQTLEYGAHPAFVLWRSGLPSLRRAATIADWRPRNPGFKAGK